MRHVYADLLVVLLFVMGATTAHAFPFGGAIGTTATKTYQFGPPSHAGQWLLGLAGAPYYCIYRISPLTVYTGISITMMGSSGPAAPAASPTLGPSTSPTPPTPPTPPPPPTPNPPPIPPPETLD